MKCALEDRCQNWARLVALMSLLTLGIINRKLISCSYIDFICNLLFVCCFFLFHFWKYFLFSVHTEKIPIISPKKKVISQLRDKLYRSFPSWCRRNCVALQWTPLPKHTSPSRLQDTGNVWVVLLLSVKWFTAKGGGKKERNLRFGCLSQQKWRLFMVSLDWGRTEPLGCSTTRAVPPPP